MSPPPFSDQTVKRVLEPITTDKIVNLAKKLIKIRSVSGKETKIQTAISTNLRKVGITVKEIPNSGSGKNLIAKIEFSKKGPQVMLG
ncbi:MAG: hypothetical protein ACW976_05325, partial [Candidatus Ranarchaeia archaeon]